MEIRPAEVSVWMPEQLRVLLILSSSSFLCHPPIRFWRIHPVWRCVAGWGRCCGASSWVCSSTGAWPLRTSYCWATAWSARACRCSPRETGTHTHTHTRTLTRSHTRSHPTAVNDFRSYFHRLFPTLCLRVCNSREKTSAKPPPDPRLAPPSCLLLPPTPKRGGQKAHISSRTNMHILVDAGLKVHVTQISQIHITHLEGKYFRLVTDLCLWNMCMNPCLPQLLHLSLRKSIVTSAEASTLEMLDPFVLLLLECIDSMHIKVQASDDYTSSCCWSNPFWSIK